MKTRKRTAMILLIILTVLSAVISQDTSYASKNEQPVMTCFKASKAKLEESVLSGWVSLDKAFTYEQELNSKLDMIINRLGFDKSKTKRISENGEDMLKTTLISTEDYVNYTIVIESMINDDKSEKSYCFFSANYSDGNDKIIEDKLIAENALADAGFPIKLDILMIGSYKGKLTRKQSDSIMNELLECIGARVVESMTDEEVISISSYSSRISHYINSQGRKINLQAAIRYSEYNDKTYLWLGCPVISLEY